jgi:hypothetical protein
MHGPAFGGGCVKRPPPETNPGGLCFTGMRFDAARGEESAHEGDEMIPLAFLFGLRQIIQNTSPGTGYTNGFCFIVVRGH